MTASTSASPLLALPLELRTKVYEHLLAPEPGTVDMLYHDRSGCSYVFNYHPAILRTNRQIHDEAISILYDNNIFRIELVTPVVRQCTGGNYSDRSPNPGPLIWDITSPAQVSGLISPESLRRLRNIEILTCANAVWGAAQMGCYFSHIGKLVLDILRILADSQEQVSDVRKKRLTFKFWLGRRGGRLFDEREREDRGEKNWRMMRIIQEKKEIAAAVRAVAQCREVEVYEYECEPESGIWTQFVMTL